MDYLPTLAEKWPHSKGNVGKYSLHGESGVDISRFFSKNVPKRLAKDAACAWPFTSKIRLPWWDHVRPEVLDRRERLEDLGKNGCTSMGTNILGCPVGS